MEPLSLFQNKRQRLFFFLLLSFIFSVNLFLHYNLYKNFTKDEIIQIDATVLNIYPKESYNVVKLSTDHYTFFTSVPLENKLQQLQKLNLFIITQKISFLEYLKGFYTKSFNHHTIKSGTNLKSMLQTSIATQHRDTNITSLYSALFLATNITPSLRDFTTDYGIAHLIAISGFHLGVLSAVLYFLLHLLYKPIHQKYFPYRNKRFDILIVTALVLFGYLLLLDFVPSLLRAFTMLLFGLLMLRSNIKLLSFDTLFIIVLIILALFPKLLFSLSLWFSVAGVFYIFLFLYYFKNYNKYFQIVFFNIWIFLAINPIVHYFFPITSFEQLYSPILTLLFTFFYPITAFLHLIGFGDIFDIHLIEWTAKKVIVWEKATSLEFFIVYLTASFIAIFSKKGFYLLNLLLGAFGIYLFI